MTGRTKMENGPAKNALKPQESVPKLTKMGRVFSMDEKGTPIKLTNFGTAPVRVEPLVAVN